MRRVIAFSCFQYRMKHSGCSYFLIHNFLSPLVASKAVVNFAIGGSSMRLFAAMVDGGLVLSSNPAKLASSVSCETDQAVPQPARYHMMIYRCICLHL